MRTWIHAASLALALIAGCAGDIAPSEGEVGASSEELRIGSGGLGAASCPGGGSPACVVCNNGCKYACSGDYTCDTAPSVCSYSPGQCTTLSFAPIGGGIIMY